MILVLEAGRIAQAGTHEELMGSEGPYRLAARLQVADDASRQLLRMNGGGT
jgi:ABC-type multidrug transport system fused ATPase/permease subunit